MSVFEVVWIRDDGEGYPEFTSENDSNGTKFVKAEQSPQAGCEAVSAELAGYKPDGDKIPVEFVDQLFEELAKINEMDPADIVWTEKGKPINIHPKDLKDFKFTGLSNSYFARLKFWRKGL